MQRTRRQTWISAVAAAGLLLLAAPWIGPAAGRAETKVDAPGRAEDYMIVDCLLPGKLRRLGRRSTFVTAGRPVRTTVLDCQVRGGEYTEFDRADYKTALEVWRADAAQGNAEAQYYVGQIYEKGLGREPDYEAAAEWYGQAAEQGYSAAQVSLGYLHERGLGVVQDSARALNLYRAASGLPEEMIVLERSEYDRLLELRRELEQSAAEGERLETEMAKLEGLVDAAESEQRQHAALRGEVDRMRQELEAERSDADALRREISGLEAELESGGAGAGKATAAAPPTPLPPLPTSVDYGPYRALVIGNGDYAALPPLPNAEDEARAVAALLEERYDFQVATLVNASRYEILTELNRLREELTEEDNLLVYYVGHSAQDSPTQRSWWQPVDAEPKSRANWISERVISDQLDTIPAKHLLVVADAAFSGLLTRSAVARLPQGMTDKKRRDYLRAMLKKRSRLAIASGEGPSPFTPTLRQILVENDGVLEASRLYRQVSSTLAASDGAASAIPQFAPIRFARSDGGADFFFVPRR